MSSEPDLIFDLSPEKPSSLATRKLRSQDHDQPFSFFSDPLFFKSPPDVSNATPSENETPKIVNGCEHSSDKADEKQSTPNNDKSSSGKKLFVRTVGFGDKAVSTSVPITPSIK